MSTLNITQCDSLSIGEGGSKGDSDAIALSKRPEAEINLRSLPVHKTQLTLIYYYIILLDVTPSRGGIVSDTLINGFSEEEIRLNLKAASLKIMSIYTQTENN